MILAERAARLVSEIAVERLKLEVARLRRERFGASSERTRGQASRPTLNLKAGSSSERDYRGHSYGWQAQNMMFAVCESAEGISEARRFWRFRAAARGDRRRRLRRFGPEASSPRDCERAEGRGPG